MSLNSRLTASVTVRDTASSPGLSANTPLVFDAFNTEKVLTDVSTPVAGSKYAVFTKTLSGSTGSIDLTAIVTALQGTVDMTGKKTQFLLVKATAENAGVLTIAKGASNGIGIDSGNAAFTLPLSPGVAFVIDMNDLPHDVDSTHKVWDLSGTSGDSISVTLVGG